VQHLADSSLLSADITRNSLQLQSVSATASVYTSQNEMRRFYRTLSRDRLSHRQPASADTFRGGFRIPGSDKRDTALYSWHFKYRWWSRPHPPVLTAITDLLWICIRSSKRRWSEFTDVYHSLCNCLTDQFLCHRLLQLVNRWPKEVGLFMF